MLATSDGINAATSPFPKHVQKTECFLSFLLSWLRRFFSFFSFFFHNIHHIAKKERRTRAGMQMAEESVIVVMDASRSQGNVAALRWALNHIVRPKDTVIVLGVLGEFGKKSSCFPFHMGIGISSIWERLEFSMLGDMTHKVLEEEIMKKREEYQHALQPLYLQCKRSEVDGSLFQSCSLPFQFTNLVLLNASSEFDFQVKLEVKLAAGFSPRMITIEEAQNVNTRWIVLDSQLKKERAFISTHVACNIAVMKGSNMATIIPSTTTKCRERQEASNMSSTANTEPFAPPPEPLIPEGQDTSTPLQEEEGMTSSPLSSPCWLPLSWRPGFPHEFTLADVQAMTNGFADENMVYEDEKLQLFGGLLLEAPLLVKCFAQGDDRFWSELRITSRVRHRSILNLVGYCCTPTTMFLLHDNPCNGPLEVHLHGIDALARKLSVKVRWNIALTIGDCLRYLHEECVDGPYVHLDVTSANIVLSHCRSALLTHFTSARRLGDDPTNCTSSSVNGHSEHENAGEKEELLYTDVRAYGVLLLELITGQPVVGLEPNELEALVGQVLVHLENNSLSELVDQRLTDFHNALEVRNMASAALLCLKGNSSPRPSISKKASLKLLFSSGTAYSSRGSISNIPVVNLFDGIWRQTRSEFQRSAMANDQKREKAAVLLTLIGNIVLEIDDCRSDDHDQRLGCMEGRFFTLKKRISLQ
ncbi:hypothetical protein ACLOJK_001170 [Asimina triloba]